MKDIKLVIKWIVKQIRPFIIVLIFITVLGAILSLFSVGGAIASKNLIDFAVAKESNSAIWSGIIFFALIVSQLGLNAVLSIISTRTYEAMSNKMREDLFVHLLRSDWRNFSKYHSDDVLTRMTSDINVVAGGIVNTIPGLISLGVQLIAAFVTLFFFDPMLAILAFVISPTSVIFYRVLGKKLKKMHIEIQEAEGVYRAFIRESIANVLIVKAFNLENQSSHRINNLQKERLDWVVKRNVLGTVSSSILAFGYWIGYLLAFAWGAIRLSKGTSTFGTLTAFLQLVGQIQGPFVGLARTFPQVIATEGSALRLIELENIQKELTDTQAPSWNRVGVRINNVSFEYEQGKHILKDVNIKINPGEIVAVVGHSGEGKTTFIRLLLSLIQPSNGEVAFFGEDGKEANADASTRQLISYVPQGNTLFSGTIAENLRLGSPKATDIELIEAARLADAWEFIETLEDGLDTKIGERGLGLSEGQAQRIAIARALIRNTPVLVLDEATSALDVDTEMNVLHAINSLTPSRTCILITHRPTAIEKCDRVLRIKNGFVNEVSAC